MKKPIKNQEDIFYYVAQETGVSEEVVKNVYYELWEAIRYYLTHPLECGKQLMLNTFMKFMISEAKLYRYIRRLEEGTGHIPKDTSKDITFYKELFRIAAGESYEERNNKIKERENGKRQISQES